MEKNNNGEGTNKKKFFVPIIIVISLLIVGCGTFLAINKDKLVENDLIASSNLNSSNVNTSAKTANVKLNSYDDRIKATKAVHEFTKLGLKESSDLIESAPCIILENTSIENATQFIKKLDKVGAHAELIIPNALLPESSGSEDTLIPSETMGKLILDSVGENPKNTATIIASEKDLRVPYTLKWITNHNLPIVITDGITAGDAEKITMELKEAGATYHFEKYKGDESEKPVDVRLLWFNDSNTSSRLNLTKTIREYLGIELQDAHNLISNTPSIIKENISRNEAETIKSMFDPYEAIVEIGNF